RYLHALEIGEILQSSLGAIDERTIVGIAFGEVEFAPDHVIARAGVAADIDSLDIGALSLVDRERQIDGPRLRVADRARAHGREGEAPFGGFDGHLLDALLHRLGVVDVARIGAQPRAQQRRIEQADRRNDVDRPKAVLLALLDRESNYESP